MRKNGDSKEWQSERAAANGILNRRVFLEGAFVAAAAGGGSTAAGAEPLVQLLALRPARCRAG